MHSRLERLAPLSGIGFLVLWIAGFFLAVADSPDFAAEPRENLEYYLDNKGSIIAGVIVSALALVLLLWFLGCVRAAMVRAEGGDARVAATGFAGGIIGVGLEMAAMAMFMLPARLHDGGKQLLLSAATMTAHGSI